MYDIFSYITSFISTILGLCEPFSKKMRTILIFNFTGNFLVGVSYFLVGSYTGGAVCAVACVQVCINYIFDARKKKIPLYLIIIYAIAFLGVNLISFGHWYDVLSLLASLVFVLSVAQSDAKYYRLLYALNSGLWIFYDLFSRAYGNLSTHIILFVATTVAVMIRDHSKKTIK